MNNNSFKEKKLVIESLGLPLRSVENWNPETDRNTWTELFDKIIEKRYKNRFDQKIILYNGIEADSISISDYSAVLITPPSVLWKCLLEVLTTESSNR